MNARQRKKRQDRVIQEILQIEALETRMLL